MSILITICARGGSKGVPGKNIKIINNIPLIGYTIDTAKKFAKRNANTDIGFSSDSSEIKDIAEQLGLKTSYTRPDYLATDTAGKLAAIIDLKEYQEKKNGKQYDYVLDLDVTSPLRSVQDLENSLKMLQEDKEAVTIFSVSPANRNPYFNMVEEKPDGYVQLVKIPDKPFLSRQAAPRVFDMNASFYFFTKKFFEKKKSSPITDKSLAYIVSHLCFDVDHHIDFEFMEYLIVNNRLDFEL